MKKEKSRRELWHPSPLFDFDSDKVEAEKKSETVDKILFWKKKLRQLAEKTPSYSYPAKEKYTQRINAEVSYLEAKKEMLNKDEQLDTKNKVLSPLEKVKQVEDARKKEGINNYDEAIDLVESGTGERPFADYESFKGVRYRWKDYL
ncbi:MAG TPA: hypothetical protein VK106_02230 [Balneolaceae bacterium]|nr:hypothetical protein [Balneolaceae bacterium]